MHFGVYWFNWSDMPTYITVSRSNIYEFVSYMLAYANTLCFEDYNRIINNNSNFEPNWSLTTTQSTVKVREYSAASSVYMYVIWNNDMKKILYISIK